MTWSTLERKYTNHPIKDFEQALVVKSKRPFFGQFSPSCEGSSNALFFWRIAPAIPLLKTTVLAQEVNRGPKRVSTK